MVFLKESITSLKAVLYFNSNKKNFQRINSPVALQFFQLVQLWSFVRLNRNIVCLLEAVEMFAFGIFIM